MEFNKRAVEDTAGHRPARPAAARGSRPAENAASAAGRSWRAGLWPRTSAVAGVAAVLLLAATGCSPAGTASPAGTPAGTPGGGPAATSSASPAITATDAGTSASGTAPASAAPVPSPDEWRTFSSPGAKISFEYPASWTVSIPAGAAGPPAVDVDVTDAEGIVVASLHYGPSGVIGGACEGAVPYTVLDSVELALPYRPTSGSVTPRFTFRALQEPGHVTASYGLTSTVAGADGTSCMFYNVVNGPAESPLYSFADAFQVNAGRPAVGGNRKGAKTFASLDEARAYMQSPEYVKAKRMITSLKINAA